MLVNSELGVISLPLEIRDIWEHGREEIAVKQSLGLEGLGRILSSKKETRDFPGGPVVKNRLAMQRTLVQSLVKELRSHILWSNSACVPQLLSLHTLEPALGSHCACTPQ